MPADLPAVQEIHKKTLLSMFDWLVPPALRIVAKACRMPVKQDDIHMVQSLCALCKASLHLLFGPRADSAKIAGEISGALESTFLFSLIWSLGAAVDTHSRSAFDRCEAHEFTWQSIRRALHGAFPHKWLCGCSLVSDGIPAELPSLPVYRDVAS